MYISKIAETSIFVEIIAGYKNVDLKSRIVAKLIPSGIFKQ